MARASGRPAGSVPGTGEAASSGAFGGVSSGAAPWDPGAVRRLRRFLGDSQAELAERLGTRQQTVSEWETGASHPRRMSRRLLHMVAESTGYYDAGPSHETGGDWAGTEGSGTEGSGTEGGGTS
jgi:hypothetical protein